MNPDLKGIFPPLPTSFHTNEDLYPDKIRENINQLLNHDSGGAGFLLPALKAAMDHMGLYGGTVRKPLLPLDTVRMSELIDLL